VTAKSWVRRRLVDWPTAVAGERLSIRRSVVRSSISLSRAARELFHILAERLRGELQALDHSKIGEKLIREILDAHAPHRLCPVAGTGSRVAEGQSRRPIVARRDRSHRFDGSRPRDLTKHEEIQMNQNSPASRRSAPCYAGGECGAPTPHAAITDTSLGPDTASNYRMTTQSVPRQDAPTGHTRIRNTLNTVERVPIRAASLMTISPNMTNT
jgi:hypothetical protein